MARSSSVRQHSALEAGIESPAGQVFIIRQRVIGLWSGIVGYLLPESTTPHKLANRAGGDNHPRLLDLGTVGRSTWLLGKRPDLTNAHDRSNSKSRVCSPRFATSPHPTRRTDSHSSREASRIRGGGIRRVIVNHTSPNIRVHSYKYTHFDGSEINVYRLALGQVTLDKPLMTP